jgi:hypothetical protein
MAMVQAQNAKKHGWKVSKKEVKLSTFFFSTRSISAENDSVEGSTWAQNVPTNHHKRHDSTDVSIQSFAYAPHSTWKS